MTSSDFFSHGTGVKRRSGLAVFFRECVIAFFCLMFFSYTVLVFWVGDEHVLGFFWFTCQVG